MSQHHKPEQKILPGSDEFRRAWEYHANADDLLHSRVQSFLIAQAFLVASYFVLLASASCSKPLAYMLSGAVVIALGLAFTLFLGRLNRRILNGLELLKEILGNDPVYSRYLNAGQRKARQTEGEIAKILPIYIPRLFLFFWLAMTVVSLFFLPKNLSFGLGSCPGLAL